MSELTTLIPALGGLLDSAPWLPYFGKTLWYLILVIAIGGLFFAKKKTFINRTICAVLSIVTLYLTAIFMYCLIPSLRDAILQLPFLYVSSDCFILMAPLSMSWDELYVTGLNFIILAFLMNLAESMIPTTKSILNWIAWRIFTVLCVLFAYSFYLAIMAYLPLGFIEGAFIVILGLTLLSLLLLLLQLVVLALSIATKPVIGTVFGFFTVHNLGSQLSKTTLSCVFAFCALQWLEAKQWNFVPFEYFDIGIYWPSWLLCVVALFVFSRIFHVGKTPKPAPKAENKCPCPKK